jgi:hypothetical protein
MPITDEEAAVKAINALSKLSPKQEAAKSEIATILSSGGGESFVDIQELFKLYNVLYFRSLLLPQVEVSWSSRLTLCAGMCELTKDSEGEYRRIRIKLSEALLKFRPRSDMVNTLLHECIHAYFFITTVFQHVRDPTGGHGPGFQMLASAINDHGAYVITEFHEFHDEVESYRTHVWQCQGPCREEAPFFGLVKRTMNRPPGKYDPWWQKHTDECGGSFTKIAEPKVTKKQLDAMSARERAGRQKNKIDSWITVTPLSPTSANEGLDNINSNTKDLKRPRSAGSDCVEVSNKTVLVHCPICDKPVADAEINEHLDIEHPP